MDDPAGRALGLEQINGGLDLGGIVVAAAARADPNFQRAVLNSVVEDEIALAGATSEDVDESLGPGQFGMADETGRLLNGAINEGGAQGLGLAQGATDYALEYAKSRETMGKPIAEHQLIAATLADMETKCEAARGLLYKCGQLIDDGADGVELTKISAMAKLYCTDVAMEVTTDAVQILGGYGYMQEYPLERMMRDAKITQIYGRC